MKYGDLGTISHATMRTEDLLPTLTEELERLLNANRGRRGNKALRAVVKEADAIIRKATKAAEAGEDASPIWNSEDAELVLNEGLFDALAEFAPPYCYFGAHEGDGSDFGFWPSSSAIEELPRVKDNSPEAIKEATKDGDDCRYVNDHGNLTIFNSKGEVVLDLV